MDERTPLLDHQNSGGSGSGSNNNIMSTQGESSSSGTSRATMQRRASHASGHDEEVDVVLFEPGDPENPRNWSEARKWFVIVPIVIVDLSVSWGASGYSPAMQSFMADMHVGSEVGTLGLSLYILGLALGPMSLAPLSEYYGRSPLYIIPFGVYVLFLMATALAPNLGAFMAFRFFSGLFSGVTVANLGGTIADMWPRYKVGIPVSWWLWAAVGGSPSGFFLMSLVAQYRGWRDVFWALTGICGGLWLMMSVVLLMGNETRHSVILRNRAARLRQEKGTSKVDVPDTAKERSLGKLFKITLTRPFRLLFTEAIIVFGALYNGYLYGLSFLFNGAYSLVFGPKGYGFDTLHVGLIFLAFFVGVSIGPFTYLWQERHYRKRIHADPPASRSDQTPIDDGYFKNLPESRLQIGKVAAVALPISLWWFAWTCVPEYHIHWIVPTLATAFFGWSFYNLILMTYLYTEDSYMVFSASALAGVALIRNLAGAGFPLFGQQLFLNLGYNWAGTVLAALSMLLIPIPFILERYGLQMRAKSPWARHAIDEIK